MATTDDNSKDTKALKAPAEGYPYPHGIAPLTPTARPTPSNAAVDGPANRPAITDAQLQNWFTYHAPSDIQKEQYFAIRNAGLLLATVIRDNCPPCADTTAAIRRVRDCVMAANQAIACEGQ
jgi:hypothetical protein